MVVALLLWLAISEGLNKQNEPSVMYWELFVFLEVLWALFYYVQTYSGWLPRVF